MALAHGHPAPGPEDDVEGWNVTSTKIRGRIFNQRDVEIDCKFALPAPTSYYRSNPVPFTITLSSLDTQALDLLASSKSLLIQLRQHVALRADSSKTAGTKTSTLVNVVSQGMFHNTRMNLAASSGVKIMEGLVGIGEGLLPGFDCPMMHLNVCPFSNSRRRFLTDMYERNSIP